MRDKDKSMMLYQVIFLDAAFYDPKGANLYL